MSDQPVDVPNVTDQPDLRCHLDCTFEECGVCQDLENLEREVHAAQELLRNLAERRVVLNGSRNVIHDRLSTKLPVEIISDIFILVDKDNDHSSSDGPPVKPKDYFCAPAVLSSGCRKWREIALALPKLWTNFYINIWREPDQLAEEWLNRSGSLPLNLTLFVNRDRKPDNSSLVVRRVCKILRSHSARWEYLNIEHASKRSGSLYTLLGDLQVMPSSKSLYLRFRTYDCDYDRAIRLKTLLQPNRFRSENFDESDMMPLPCQWNNLTHLELHSHGIDRALGIIRAAPKLKRCILREMNRPFPLRNVVPFEHKSLHSLELTFDGSGTDFFQNITLPSLRHLKYETGHEPNHDELQDLKDFLQLNSTSLQTFSLEYRGSLCRDSDYNMFLELTTVTQVTHLSFGISSDSKTLESVLLKISDFSVFPHLQQLRIRMTWKGDSDKTLGPPSCAALCHLVTEHNSRAKMDIDLESRISGSCHTTSTVDEISGHIHRNDTGSNLSANGQQYTHSLKSISVLRLTKLPSLRIQMKKDVFLRLREAQRVGPIKLEIGYENLPMDVLQDPRYVRNLADSDECVVIVKLPSTT